MEFVFTEEEMAEINRLAIENGMSLEEVEAEYKAFMVDTARMRLIDPSTTPESNARRLSTAIPTRKW